jgi:hypothetical protein
MNEPLASQIPPFRNLRVQVEVITHCNVQYRICVRPHPASTWSPGRSTKSKAGRRCGKTKTIGLSVSLGPRAAMNRAQMCQECVEYEVEE